MVADYIGNVGTEARHNSSAGRIDVPNSFKNQIGFDNQMPQGLRPGHPSSVHRNPDFFEIRAATRESPGIATLQLTCGIQHRLLSIRFRWLTQVFDYLPS